MYFIFFFNNFNLLHIFLGRVQEAFHTSKNLLTFWRKVSNISSDFMSDASINYDDNSYSCNTTLYNGNVINTLYNGADITSASNTLKTIKQFPHTVNTPGNTQKLSKEVFVPVTPIFTAPLGIATSSHISLATCHDVTGKSKKK